MALTPTQLTTLKAAILANPAWNAYPNTLDGAFDLAAQKLNVEAVPAYVVWRTAVTRGEILQNGFDWTRLDNLSVGKARIWNDIFVNDIINPSKLNVRAGIEEVWKGTAPDLAVQAAVYAHCKANATEFEKLFAVGSGTTLSPSTRGVAGDVFYADVYAARNLV